MCWMIVIVGQFQSLFSWNSPSDDAQEATAIFDSLFQSLFSWNSPSDFDDNTESGLAEMFQSLFSWNSPSDIMLSSLLWRPAYVSILVFVELALGLHRQGQ